jgi:2-polyprenyl-3-methyl-5-hydroxy-6-metoxy-1,4-benzoquinol methylase
MNSFSSPNNPKCIVTLSFDDGYEETLNSVLPILSDCKLKASFNVITGNIGKFFEDKKVADWKELKGIARMGHEITSHSSSHTPIRIGFENLFSRFLRSLFNSRNKVRFLKRARKFILSHNFSDKNFSVQAEFISSKESIEEKIPGYVCSSFVYPGGNYNREAKKSLESIGYASARSLDIGFNNPGKLNPYSLKAQVWDSSTTAEEANRWVDYAIKNNLWLIECFHLIGKENKENYLYFTPLEKFERHIKYINEKNCLVTTQREAIERVKSIEKNKEFSDYSLKTIYFYDNKLPFFIEKIFKSKQYRKAKIVDLGCGDGRLLIALKSNGYFSQNEFYGVDISKEKINYLKDVLPEVKPIVSDASDIKELNNNEFDVVICSQLIEHVPSEDSLIKEIRRLVKRDGIVYVSSIIKKWYGLWIYRLNGKIRLDPTHLREYSSEEEFVNLLEKNRLKCKEVKITPLKYSIFDLFLRFLIKLSIIKPEGFQNFFLRHNFAFKIKNILKIRVPGYYTIETLSEIKD